MNHLLPFLLLVSLPAMAFTPLSPRSGPPFVYQADALAYWRKHGPPMPNATTASVAPAQGTPFVLMITANWNPYYPNAGVVSGPTIIGPWTLRAEWPVQTDGTAFPWTDSTPRTEQRFYRAVNLP
jgi:hypothetical protein